MSAVDAKKDVYLLSQSLIIVSGKMMSQNTNHRSLHGHLIQGCGAIFSDDRVYRYLLWRQGLQRGMCDGFDSKIAVSSSKDLIAFIGLNPSTANETQDDPTIRRCINFAKSWGYNGIVVLNLFAYCATHSSELRKAEDPVGSLNDFMLQTITEICQYIVCCWGVHGVYRQRGNQVRYLLTQQLNLPVYHLGLTKEGHPKHPLYLSSKTQPVIWFV